MVWQIHRVFQPAVVNQSLDKKIVVIVVTYAVQDMKLIRIENASITLCAVMGVVIAVWIAVSSAVEKQNAPFLQE